MLTEEILKNIRTRSTTQILYVIIHNADNQYLKFAELPFNTSGLYKLMTLPKDLLELEYGPKYFSFSVNMPIKFPYEVLFAHSSQVALESEYNFLNMLSSFIPYKNFIVVFIIDESYGYMDALLNRINNFNIPIWYFTNFLEDRVDNLKYYTKYYFNDYYEFIGILKRDTKKITEFLNKKTNSEKFNDLSFNNTSDFELDIENKLYDFKPIYPNAFTLNRIIGNFWRLPKIESENNLNYVIGKSPGQTDRIKLILNKAELIDELYWKYVRIGRSWNNPKYEPLILIAPFHSPKIRKAIKSLVKGEPNLKVGADVIFKFYSSEQTTDYLNHGDVDDKYLLENLPESLREFIFFRYAFIDCLAYLHSSFTDSPVIRLPAIGKSINKEFSFFSPEAKNFFSSEADSFNNILTLGSKLEKLLLHNLTKKYISSRYGQIVAISDLPLEWMQINNVPLSFSHDVCRVHEFYNMGVQNQYSLNAKFNFVIDNNILSKTLVIHGASDLFDKDKQMKGWIPLVDDLSKELGFTHVHCRSIDEVSNLVKDFNPQILVFDCHGEIDKDTLSSYLVINNEKLTIDKIISESIGAPIVFLSACNTTPNYGYINSVADAFFQVGAIAVTSTFLPISVDNANILYIRMLRLLAETLNNNIHKNWLSFICYVNRTSIIQEAFFKAMKKVKFENISQQDDVLVQISEIMAECNTFENRIRVFNKLLNGEYSIGNNKAVQIKNIRSEFLLYSHLGRADLIFFNNWVQVNSEYM